MSLVKSLNGFLFKSPIYLIPHVIAALFQGQFLMSSLLVGSLMPYILGWVRWVLLPGFTHLIHRFLVDGS